MERTASFECLLVNLSRFSVYHHHVTNKVEETVSQGTGPQQWDEIFAINVSVFFHNLVNLRSRTLLRPHCTPK